MRPEVLIAVNSREVYHPERGIRRFHARPFNNWIYLIKQARCLATREQIWEDLYPRKTKIESVTAGIYKIRTQILPFADPDGELLTIHTEGYRYIPAIFPVIMGDLPLSLRKMNGHKSRAKKV